MSGDGIPPCGVLQALKSGRHKQNTRMPITLTQVKSHAASNSSMDTPTRRIFNHVIKRYHLDGRVNLLREP